MISKTTRAVALRTFASLRRGSGKERLRGLELTQLRTHFPSVVNWSRTPAQEAWVLWILLV